MELKDLTIESLRKDRPDLIELIVSGVQKEKQTELLKVENDALKLQIKEKDENLVTLEAKLLNKTRDEEIAALVREAQVPEELKYEEKDVKKVIKSTILGVLTRCSNQEERQDFIKQWEGMCPTTTKKTEKPVSSEQVIPTTGPTPVNAEAMQKWAQAL